HSAAAAHTGHVYQRKGPQRRQRDYLATAKRPSHTAQVNRTQDVVGAQRGTEVRQVGGKSDARRRYRCREAGEEGCPAAEVSPQSAVGLSQINVLSSRFGKRRSKL